MLKSLWGFVTRLEVGMAGIIVLIGASIWASSQPIIFGTRGVVLLLGFIAFSLSAFTIEKIRQLITQEITFKKFGSVFAL